MKKLLFFLLPFTTTLVLAQKNDGSAQFADLITEQALKEKLTIVASAEMEGRETASPGQKRAAAYIESLFKSYGLKPGNGNSYQQLFPVYQEFLTEKNLQVNGKTFTWDKDFTFSLWGLNNTDLTVNDIVFAGYGNVDEAKKINDFAGLDVKNKIVMILTESGNNANGGARSAMMDQFQKMNAVVKMGAAGLLFVSQDFPRKNPTPLKGGMSLKAPSAAPATSFLMATISSDVASALLGRTAPVSFSQLAEANNGKYVAELHIVAKKSAEELESSNVIGILPGTDKKDEYVFLTGHYDHLGKNGDVIYYGADDDGSGTVSVLQMAEAFSAAAKKGHRPRRSIIFMTVSGEEKGLLGSEYYSEHPTIDMTKASVDLNTDMVGRVDTERKTGDTLNYVYVIGHDKLSSDLPVINEGVNKEYTNLVLDYKYDDPNDQNRIYYRSDHYNFAKKGIPILFFYDGMLLADYHQPTDTVDKINFPLMEKRVRMIFHTGWAIANRDDMLKRDIPLNMPGR